MPPTSPPCSAGSSIIEGEAVRAPILTSQMRRDRLRLAEAQAEIARMRDEIRRLESMPAHPAYERVKRVYLSLS